MTASAKSLYEIYKDEYMQYLVGQRIEELMEAEPEKQYPEARAMKRRFILHIGPTNSGKTYEALQRLKQAYHGIYLGPLRLLALEVYDRMMTDGIPCDMITPAVFFHPSGILKHHRIAYLRHLPVQVLHIRQHLMVLLLSLAQDTPLQLPSVNV